MRLKFALSILVLMGVGSSVLISNLGCTSQSLAQKDKSADSRSRNVASENSPDSLVLDYAAGLQSLESAGRSASDEVLALKPISFQALKTSTNPLADIKYVIDNNSEYLKRLQNIRGLLATVADLADSRVQRRLRKRRSRWFAPDQVFGGDQFARPV